MNGHNFTTLFHNLLVCWAFFIFMGEQRCSSVDFQKDSIQIRTLLATAQNTSIKDFHGAISETQIALDLAYKLDNKKLIIIVYRAQGNIFEENNRLNDAYSCYHKALSLIDDVPTNLTLDIYLDWAIINKKLSKYDVTRDYYQRALDLAYKAHDLEIVEFAYSGFGTLNGALGEFDKAIDYHLQAKEIAEKRNNITGVISALVNISTVYTQSKNYQLAYGFLKKGYDLACSVKDSMRIAYIFNIYGKALNAEKKYKEAIVYHLKALNYCELSNNKAMIAQTLGFMVDVYTQMKEFESAEKTFKRCFEYSSYFDFYEQPNLYLSIGYFYLKTKRPNEASDALKKSLDLASERGFIDLIQKAHRGIADVYQQLGDNKQAIKHIKIAKIFGDSIFNGDKITRIAEAQYKFDMSKAEAEHKLSIAKSETELQVLRLNQNRIILFLVSILLGAVLTFFIFYTKQKSKNNFILSQKSIEIQLKNSRLEKSNEVLQQFAYASAHDLKEPLRSISGFVSIINRKYAQLLPPESHEFLNFVVVGVKRMETLIAALLEYSTLASDEEDIKQATPVLNVLHDVNANLHSVISEKNAEVAYLGYLPALKISRLHLTQLFQNLIGNALKFCNKKPLVQVTGKLNNDQYILEIKDNGIGIKKEYSDKIFLLFQRLSRSAQYEGTGIGLAICKQIVDKYEGTIRFESVEKEGATFILCFPAKVIDTHIK